MPIIKGLNEAQLEAVTNTEGPLLIIAGAGSGKTRVLTHRIAYLLEIKKIPPWQVLAITFTNKAANEMKERLQNLVGPAADDMWVSTFHSACVRILRSHAEKIGFNSNFVIYDMADKETLIKQCLQLQDLDPKRFSPKAIGAAISNAKNELKDARKFSKEANNYFMDVVSGIYTMLEEKMAANNAFDFDDLLMKTVELFQSDKEVLRFYQNRFTNILVDEYQDTNHAQYILVNLLAKKHRHLCVVGDPDQSIYRWRGADIKNILNFERDYPEAKVIKLEQNYRSTASILHAANAVIEYNPGRKKKNLWTDNPSGEKVCLIHAENERDEAARIISEIITLKSSGNILYGDMAVLYRAHAQSRALEEELVRNNISYQIFGGTKFYDRKEIKDILAYLKILVNKDDDIGFARIINVPKRGIGAVSQARIESFALEKGISLYDVLPYVHEVPGLTGRALKQLQRFRELLEKFQEERLVSSVTEITSSVLHETGYLDALIRDNTVEAETRRDNLREFLNVTTSYDQNNPAGSLEDFLAEISLVTDIDNYVDEADKLVLMTLHTAKGLEFPVVFIMGMEEGTFPHFRSLENEYEMEEERRLCYVGMTRAEKKLYLSLAGRRLIYGITHSKVPSRFLDEIPREYLEYMDRKKEPAKVNYFTSGPFPQKPVNTYRLGDKVFHKKFGEGVVIETKPDDTEIKVAFPGQGIKNLDICFAPLKVLPEE
ncbi:MAG: DNA helicase PcrA [Firmicutes bacterium]|nr:DNA helicase PcrA [Bacillota bacterium]